MSSSLRALLGASLGALLAACGGAPRTIGYDLHRAPLNAHRKAPPPPARQVDPEIVSKARGPVHVWRLSDGADLGERDYERELLSHDALCAGEQHGTAATHYAELLLLERLARRSSELGLELGLGFEMWSLRAQPLLGAYSQHRLASSAELAEKTQFEKHWGYPFAFYRPQVERALALGVPLVALNAEAELVREIARNGLGSLSPKQQRDLPELDLGDAGHRERFERVMQGHPGTGPATLDNYYAAQVVWDETMAATSARWLGLHAPMRRQLIFAGREHCQRAAIPKRMERRGIRKVAALWLGTALPPEAERGLYDYAVVVGKEEPNAAAPKPTPRLEHADLDSAEPTPS